MKIWLITIGEPLPCDGESVRILRTGILARTLAARGHEVLWWSSTYDHRKKAHRSGVGVIIDAGERYRIRLLHAIGYRRNISLRRILNHRGLARAFAREARAEPVPDLILCSLPILELCREAAAYGRARGVPVALDIRDMWPDIIFDLLPRPLRRLGPILLYPMLRDVRTACRQATALCSTTEPFAEWGLRYAVRDPGPLDRAFPHGYDATPPSPRQIEEAQEFWSRMGLRRDSGEFVACFIGTMSRQFDFATVVEAARRTPDIRFVLCGVGERLESLKASAQDCKNVLFPGWIDAPRIWTLMRLSAAGLAPYRSTPDFALNLPNKPIEYLSAGLPIVSSLKGRLEELLAEAGCGLTYGDPDSLVKALRDLREDPERRRGMSERALALFRERFDAAKVYARMSEHLERIAAWRRS